MPGQKNGHLADARALPESYKEITTGPSVLTEGGSHVIYFSFPFPRMAGPLPFQHDPKDRSPYTICVGTPANFAKSPCRVLVRQGPEHGPGM